MNNHKELSIDYWLENISIVKFFLSDSDSEDDKIKDSNLKLSVGLEGDYEKEDKKVSIIVNVLIKNDTKDIDVDNIVAELKVKYIFKVKKADELDDNNELLLPSELLNNFNNIAVSTTRGIAFTKFQATKIDNFIIPLIKMPDVSEDNNDMSEEEE